MEKDHRKIYDSLIVILKDQPGIFGQFDDKYAVAFRSHEAFLRMSARFIRAGTVIAEVAA